MDQTNYLKKRATWWLFFAERQLVSFSVPIQPLFDTYYITKFCIYTAIITKKGAKNMEFYFNYYVVFSGDLCMNYSPIIFARINNEAKKGMHQFDDNILNILPAIEYIMHLPRHIYDIYNLDEKFISASYDTSHMIFPIHEDLLPIFSTQIPLVKPTLFILSDDCSESAKKYCKEQSSYLGAVLISELNQKLLLKHWALLKDKNFSDNYETIDSIDCQCLLQERHLIALPGLFTSRQWSDTNNYLQKILNTTNLEEDVIILQHIYNVRLKTLLLMGEQGVKNDNITKEQFVEKYESIFEEVKQKFDLSVVITFPGVSKKQMKYGPSSSELTEVEKRVIRILGVHRAIARNGVVLELPCANTQLFDKLAELEDRCKEGTNNKYVWKTLKDIGKIISSSFNGEQIKMLKSAKDITVFSDIPIGLAILEDDEVPLQCYKSISYRPLTPLTRQLQIELHKTWQHNLGQKCKIAFAECVLDDENNRFVYQTSEMLRNVLLKFSNQSNKISLSYCKTYSIKDIKGFIEENKDADILYISAHGHYDKMSNRAGIMVGEEFWIAAEDLIVPPVVILSACHTSPRGIGVVNIADMFIRNGAVAVLSTFVPVCAKRNMILMTRLFSYIAEAQKGSTQYKTLADLWSGLVAGNAIHEMMSDSKKFYEWMHGYNSDGMPRIIDFQLSRSVGRLRLSHIYSDTIQIVKEMLDEEGLSGKFANILDERNYFPESAFYQFIGSPENVFLYNKIFEEAYEKGIVRNTNDDIK